MTERWVCAMAAGAILGSLGCSVVLDFDDFREERALNGGTGSDAGVGARVDEPTAPAGARFDSYQFQRGMSAPFSVPANAGVLANDSLPVGAPSGSAGLQARAGTLNSARGGRVQLAADGGFEYTPPGAPGAFWGDDSFEYELISSNPPSSARARLTVQPTELAVSELASSGAGFILGGTATQDLIGYAPRSMAAGGDINGDGLEDLIIGAPGPTMNEAVTFTAGRGVHVVFGQRSPVSLSLGELAAEPARGFTITGDGNDATLDSFGLVVGSAGDVNGDGLDDVIVGSRGWSPSPAQSTGAAYVVFGKADGAPLSSAVILAGNGGGFAIYASSVPDYNVIAYDVGGAGDVNGDGLDDVIVGVPILDDAYGGNAGGGFVVFGKVGPEPVLLETLTSENGQGFAILGDVPTGLLGVYAAGVGDVNGDGLSDVALGTELTPGGASRVAVVHGRTTTSPVLVADLALNAGGFVLTSSEPGDGAARLAAAGDVNGDGLDDVLIGAPAASLEGSLEGRLESVLESSPSDAGASDAGADASAGSEGDAGPPPPPPDPVTRPGVVYVVFGGREPRSFSLSELEAAGGPGFAIGGAAPFVNLGYEVSSGDVNGDGLGDIVATVPPSAANPDRAFVVFGKQNPAPMLLSEATIASSDTASSGVLGIVCPEGELACGVAASGADVNADGLDELLVGSLLYPTPASGAGAVYVGLGWDVTGALAGRERAIVGTSGNDVLEVTDEPLVIVRGGRGTDTLRYRSTSSELDLNLRGRYESIEIIDLRGNGAQRVRLDDSALRRIPQNHSGFAFMLARRLAVLGDAQDTLIFDREGWTPRPGANEGRTVLGQAGKYYGLEISQELQVIVP